MAPEFSQAADIMSANENVMFANVNCDDRKASGKICQSNNVTGFPTVKLFKDGEEYEDEDFNARSAGAALKGVAKILDLVTLPNMSGKLNEITAKTIVGIFEAGDSETAGKFASFATDLAPIYNMAMAEDKDLEKEFEICVVENGEKVECMDVGESADDYKEEDVKKFMFDNIFESAPTLWPNEMQNFGFPATFIFHEEPETYQALAASLNGDVKFALGKRNLYKNVLSNFDVEDSDKPVPTVIHFKDMKEVYICDISKPAKAEAEIKNFHASVVAGTAKQFIKSEPEPKQQPGEDGITVLTGNSINKVAFDDSKDVLVEIYAPWCGHCKKIAPEYSKTAKLFAGVDDLVLAKIDGTANTIPSSLDYTGFPTFYWIGKGKEPERAAVHDGSSLNKWIVSNSENKAAQAVDIPIKSEKVVAKKYKPGEVIQIAGKTFKKLVDGKRDWFIKFYAPWCGHCKAMAEPWKDFAMKLKNEKHIKIAEIDVTQNDIPPAFDVKGFPTLYWVPRGADVNDPATLTAIKQYNGGRDEAAWTKYVIENASELLGDYDIPIKSEPIPDPQESGEVIKLVGNNFKSLVETDKNVLIKFYAPWCGHCKAMADDYIQLAKGFEGQDVIIAEIDATANESPSDYEYTGFPTLFWKPAGTDKPEKYEGGRSEEDMSKFVLDKLGAVPVEKDEL